MAEFQDLSGLPTDDTMAQLELQRKLKLAQQLQQSQLPQGQMVSGHYVTPSFTQYAADLLGKYVGGKTEEEAMKKFGEYNTAKESRLANALKTLGGAFEPKTTTTMQVKDVPLEQGANVPTSPFGTSEQVSQTSPFGTQNMTGTTSQMNPVTTTIQPTLGDIEKAFAQYATDVKDPKMLASILTGKYEKMLKANEPVKLGAGESVFSATGQKLFGNPKESAKYAHVTQDKTGNSFGLNTETNQWEQLPGAKMTTEGWSAPYKVGGEWLQRNSVTGKVEKAYGSSDANKPPQGYAWGQPDASGNPTLVPLSGGPADKSVNPTEQQANAYTFSTRMEKADKILNDLEGKYSPLAISAKSSAITSNIPGAQTVINAQMSPETQKAEQAQRDFINAVLRRESGQAISQSEFENAQLQYFPQAGDSAEVKAQKAANRKTAIETIKKATAPGTIKSTQSNVVNFEDLK